MHDHIAICCCDVSVMLEGLVAPAEGLDHLMVVVVDLAPQILEDLVLVMEVAEDSAHQMEEEVLVDPVMEALEVPVVDSGTVDLEGDLGSEAAAAQKVYISQLIQIISISSQFHWKKIGLPSEKANCDITHSH